LIWWLSLIILTHLVNVLTDRQRPSNSIIDHIEQLFFQILSRI